MRAPDRARSGSARLTASCQITRPSLPSPVTGCLHAFSAVPARTAARAPPSLATCPRSDLSCPACCLPTAAAGMLSSRSLTACRAGAARCGTALPAMQLSRQRRTCRAWRQALAAFACLFAGRCRTVHLPLSRQPWRRCYQRGSSSALCRRCQLYLPSRCPTQPHLPPSHPTRPPPTTPPTPQGAKSPLLWDEGQAAELLAGSPVVAEIEARLAGIEKEYEELDAVWFLAGRCGEGDC